MLVGTIAAVLLFKVVLADESAEKHEHVEAKHGFGSLQDVKFHEKHGFPNLDVLGVNQDKFWEQMVSMFLIF